MKREGFTLIELLIVVAIIGILAAIAIPNFLEAQVRAKVARTKADLNTLNTAIEAYYVDNTDYPIDGHRSGDGSPFWYLPNAITHPVAYISSNELIDPFRDARSAIVSMGYDTPDSAAYTESDYRRYRYRNIKYTYGDSLGLTTWVGPYESVFGKWVMNGSGPDQTFGPTYSVSRSGITVSYINLIYDSSNGTVSDGDVVRSQKFPAGNLFAD